MPNAPIKPPENPESLNPTTLPEQASAGLTENVKSDVSEVLNPEAIDEFGLTLAEKAQVDDFVQTGVFTAQSFGNLPEKLRGKYLVMKLMEIRKGYHVVKNFEKFQGLNHKEIALALIENGKGDSVVENLEKFQGLDHKEIANALIEKKYGYIVVENIEKFQGLDHREIALVLIEKGDLYYVVFNLEKFQGLDHREIALAIIENEDGDSVAKNIEKFQGLDHNEIALALIENGKGWSVAKNLEKFQGLDHKEIVLALIEDDGDSVVENLEKFQGLDHKEIALALIEKGNGDSVVYNLEKFQGLDHNEIALALIKNGKGYSVINSLKGLDQAVAIKLIEDGELDSVAENIEKFQGLDQAFAIKLIENGMSWSVADNIKKFQGLDQTLASVIIEKGGGWFIVIHAIKFKGIESLYGTVLTGSKYPTGITLGDGVSISKMPQVGEYTISSISGLENINQFDYKKHIKPILDAQSVAAFLYFDSIKQVQESHDLSPDDINYITLVSKKYGTLARNILENILENVPDISAEKNTIEAYIGEIGIAHIDLYNKYKEIKKCGGNLDTLKEDISGIQSKIHQGSMTEVDFESILTPAILYHTFPPAIGITQDQYNHLIQERPDRRGDVPASLDPLQYERFSVGTGHYELGEGEELELDIWNALGVAVKKVDSDKDDTEKGKTKLDPVEVAEKLINIYQTKGINESENRAYLFEAMYRYHLSKEGGKLPDSYELSQAGLMKYKEFIGDTIKNDLLSEVIASWKVANGDKWEAFKKDTQNRFAMDNDKLYTKINGLLQGLKHAKSDAGKEKARKTLDTFLADYGMAYEQIHNLDDKSLKDFIVGQNLQRDWEDVTIRVISSYLAGMLNSQMRKEVDKFQFSDDQAGEREHELEFVISKKKEHGMIGFNMGVCVAPDAELWNDSTFMNVIIFDPKTKQAQGGMHLLIRENCLCLPGINPSTDLLGTVDNEKLYTTLIDYARAIAKNLGLKKVLIPKEAAIYSNRSQIQSIVPSKAYPTHKLEQIAKFSYSPYEYSFQDCWSVNI